MVHSGTHKQLLQQKAKVYLQFMFPYHKQEQDLEALQREVDTPRTRTQSGGSDDTDTNATDGIMYLIFAPVLHALCLNTSFYIIIASLTFSSSLVDLLRTHLRFLSHRSKTVADLGPSAGQKKRTPPLHLSAAGIVTPQSNPTANRHAVASVDAKPAPTPAPTTGRTSPIPRIEEPMYESESDDL